MKKRFVYVHIPSAVMTRTSSIAVRIGSSAPRSATGPDLITDLLIKWRFVCRFHPMVSRGAIQ